MFLKLNQHFQKREHHEVNSSLCGLEYYLICEPDDNKCTRFLWDTASKKRKM